MALPFGFGKKKEPEPRPEREPRELSPEEQLLAEKARAAAAKREAERRGQVQDVADFLGEILAPGPAQEPAASAPPAADRLLEPEPEEPGAAPPEAPPAPDSGAPAVPEAAPEAAAARRVLSEPLAPVWSEVMALGRSGERERSLEFEPEVPAELFERTAANLSARRRRPHIRLEFEPEEAGRPARAESAIATTVLPASARPAPPEAAGAPPEPAGRSELASYLLGDLAREGAAPQEPAVPSEPSLPEAAGEPLETAGQSELAKYLLDEPAREGPAPQEPAVPSEPPPPPEPAAAPAERVGPHPGDTVYSLEDLPELPSSPSPPGTEPAEKLTDIEPAMEEDQLDDAGLREALAAAEAASRGSTVAIRGLDLGGPELAPGEKYSLADLPQSPPAGPRPAAEEAQAEPSVPDDRLREEKLPELPAAAPEAPPAPAPAGPPAAAAAPPPPPAAAAENAADLSVQQLADMERYIESQVETVEARPWAPRPAAGPKRAGLASRLVAALRAPLARVRRAADRVLAPYCLSSKRLLGVAGILILAGVAAYAFKTWILPRMGGGE